MFLTMVMEPVGIEPTIPGGSGFTVRLRHQPHRLQNDEGRLRFSRGGLVDDMDFWSFYDGHPRM